MTAIEISFPKVIQHELILQIPSTNDRNLIGIGVFDKQLIADYVD